MSGSWRWSFPIRLEITPLEWGLAIGRNVMEGDYLVLGPLCFYWRWT